jgi:hypothetical protein
LPFESCFGKGDSCKYKYIFLASLCYICKGPLSLLCTIKRILAGS